VPVSSPARPSSLSASRARFAGLVRQLLSHCPMRPLFSLCAVDPPCQFRPPRARRGPASAHSRTSPDFLATTPAHVPSSLLRAPPVPRTPLPHFTQLRPLSRSSHAASIRRRPAPAFSAIQLAGDRARPPQAPPQGETPAPVLVLPYSHMLLANLASPACGRACSPRPHGVRPSRPRPMPRLWPRVFPHLH
jgi:hypothetical protein